ncbi:hypothetical protein EYF80_038548 [Liparis tanakae]|uniref:Uncharacterized protein n=1 Tax=Liparis tanakae TaxID=230148 RepID=A0A4Z2GCE3_9TELE|nr:hypothetical protein EYF80_038548 [Liparis tanakae]
MDVLSAGRRESHRPQSGPDETCQVTFSDKAALSKVLQEGRRTTSRELGRKCAPLLAEKGSAP